MSASKDDIISHLRDVLSNLHYPTRACSGCGWVSLEDDIHTCATCRRLVCEECQNIGAIGIQCDDCYGTDRVSDVYNSDDEQ